MIIPTTLAAQYLLAVAGFIVASIGFAFSAYCAGFAAPPVEK